MKTGIKQAAEFFGSTSSAVRTRYDRCKKGQNTKYIKKAVDALEPRKKSVRGKGWSKAEIRLLKKIVKESASIREAYDKAQKILGRSEDSIQIKWSRISRGIGKKKYKKRKGYSYKGFSNRSGKSIFDKYIKKKHNPQLIDTIIDDGGISTKQLVIDIKDIKVDLASMKLTIFY